MISKRIKFIASLIDENDSVLDIGTDHALLPIYLIKNNITKIADGSDVSETILLNAINNLLEYRLNEKIKLYCSDGISNIDISKYNTFVIAGMGFHTIKGILSHNKFDNINKLIIQSNNNHDELRKFINSIGYKIISDFYIKDKNKSYLIVLCEKGKQKLSNKEYICGLYNKNNIWYYKYMVDKYNQILKLIPDCEKKDILNNIKYFNEYLSKEKTEE
ncbi:MAG: SAM-dependent methyltransferase [Bacilli bacterium]|nr:SAM-dependent methyltransferase [Bacilli bacterium]